MKRYDNEKNYYYADHDLVEDPPPTHCKELGFAHAWEDITSAEVYLTNPPMYPAPRERCQNCGLIRVLSVVHTERWLYKNSGCRRAK